MEWRPEVNPGAVPQEPSRLLGVCLSQRVVARRREGGRGVWGRTHTTAYVCELRGQFWGVGSLLPQIRGCGVQTQVIRTVWQALPLPSHLSGTTLLFGKGAVVVTGGSEIQPREPFVSSAGVLRV